MASVYFMRDQRNGLVKVGRSKNLRNRQRALQREYRCELRVVAAFGPIKPGGECFYERTAHAFLMEFHVTGEWFSIEEQQIHAVIAHLAMIKRWPRDRSKWPSSPCQKASSAKRLKSPTPKLIKTVGLMLQRWRNIYDSI